MTTDKLTDADRAAIESAWVEFGAQERGSPFRESTDYIYLAGYRAGAQEMRERAAKVAMAEKGEGDPYCCGPLAELIAENIRALEVGDE